MAVTYKDVLAWISSKEFLGITPEEHRRLVEEMNAQMKLKRALSVANFRSGDDVQFQGKRGERLTGVVVRGNRTTIEVRASDGRIWRVSPSLLQKKAKPKA